MKRRAVLGYAAAGLVAAAGGVTLALRARPQSDPAVQQLFALALPGPDGQTQAFSRFRGKPLVVNFWATWCPPCVDEMPDLDRFQLELGDRARIVGIGIDSPKNVAEFVAKVPVRYPLVVAAANGTELSRQLGNANGALPFTVVIDEEGRVLDRILGRVKLDSLRTTLRLAQA